MFKNLRGTGQGLFSAVAWGLDTVLGGLILTLAPFIEAKEAIFLAPFVSVFLHDFFASFWVAIYLTIKGEMLPFLKKAIRTKSAKYAIIGGILGGPVGMTGYYLAVKYIGAGHAATISSLYPAIGALLAFFFLKEKIGRKGWIGLAIAITGIALSGFSATGESINFIGIAFALLTVIGWGSECVVCAYGMKDEEITPTEALQLRQLSSAIVYALIIIPMLKGYSLVQNVITTKEAVMLIIITALAGTVSYLCYYGAIHKLGATKAMGLNITYVVWAMILDKVLFGRDISPKMLFCAALVMLGSFMVAAQPGSEEIIEDEKSIENNTIEETI